jgi:hypothetical protein
MKNVPKFIQTIDRQDPPKQLRGKLISCFKKGGVEIDDEMLLLNPNAKKEVPCITVGGSGTKFSRKASTGQWIYCGSLWYVRKLINKYEFARFMAFNTVDKVIDDVWDQVKYDMLNNECDVESNFHWIDSSN